MKDPLIADCNQAAGRLSGELPKGQPLPAASRVRPFKLKYFGLKPEGFRLKWLAVNRLYGDENEALLIQVR